MTIQEHPSDDVLLELIHDADARAADDPDQEDLETHLSSCDHCQSRMLDLANRRWLDHYRDCLSPEFLEPAASSGRTASGTNHAASPAAGSDFETRAIRHMLDSILAPPTHPETLGRLDRYEVESIIGVGGMGLVLRGYDHELQRPVAIKMMLPRLAGHGTAKQRFIREARAVAAILHPNVIAIHGVDETQGMPWFVMPYVAGPSLRELVEKSGPLPEREIARIGLQIASGLAAAHGQGLVHRDIKPGNILLDNNINRVIITDFGLVRRRDSDDALTQTGVLTGTLSYMSPEQARGLEVDHRSDLFSLGAVLYFLATGGEPFAADTPAGAIHNILHQRPRDVRGSNPDMSKTMARTIDTLLAKQPTDRFQSATDLERFFEDYVSHLNRPTQHRVPRLPWRRSAMLQTLMGALALTLVLVAGWWAFKGRGPSPDVVSPQAMWQALQVKYELGERDELQQEVAKLGSLVNRLEREFATVERAEQQLLSSELLQAARDLRQIELGLNALQPSAPPAEPITESNPDGGSVQDSP